MVWKLICCQVKSLIKKLGSVTLSPFSTLNSSLVIKDEKTFKNNLSLCSLELEKSLRHLTLLMLKILSISW